MKNIFEKSSNKDGHIGPPVRNINKKMNTINMCRKIPELPVEILREILIAQMLTLERHLAELNPLFEEDLYLALLEKLAVVYFQVNRSDGSLNMRGNRVVVESRV